MAAGDGNIVQLQPHAVSWQWRYRWEWLILQLALRGKIHGLEHFGSTALPGMIAKPIIDIGVTVPDYDRAFTCVRVIERLGYIYCGESANQRSYYFTKGNPVRYHLYVYEYHSPEWQDKLAFRNYLRQHPNIAQEYAELKCSLARQFPTDLSAYQEGKLAFVQEVRHAARLERQENE